MGGEEGGRLGGEMEEARWKNCKVGCLESEREGKVDLKR